MLALQAAIAMAVFAPGVVAPRTGLHPEDLSLFATAVFGVGMAASWRGGALVARHGPLVVAQACCVLLVAGMAVAGLPGGFALVMAGVLVGLAFGPDTPASAALLGPLVTDRRRPFVFSIRQTGNQIGAVAGSLALPALSAAVDPRLCYAVVAAVALCVLVGLRWLQPRYPVAAAPPAPLSFAAMRRVFRERPMLMRLAAAAMAFGAMQLCLNAYFVTLAVRDWGLAHVTAGMVLAVAQAGGLAGRLGWGWVAAAWARPGPVLAALGLGMAACAVTLGLAGAALPLPLLVALAGALGLTASGWNGVFVAEITRLAPPDRIAETSGAALTAAYGGLLAGPAVVAAIAALWSLGIAFVVLGLACAAAAALIAGACR
jgi:MFS family permease